ncbi:putative toxin-antitoxin system toxin component, PIN family [Limnohabitans sp. B9-3]|uniref:putative toxin-antitoxin system toxin component, PIN family n=1 Tax=Limnohabitans sp. B9-3 TaxID=1100707 RepID=UPI000C1EB94A|nr:putative toxin-antitoxin system toxin component, PIN family [Limnohabitans sp. B9-3]PIT72333.1 putative toxin-antitoxin system toxin component, PIN family [Limnohabitans sp. B9-3]
MTSLKLVIDTNLFISAALSSQGAPAKLVREALAHHRLVFSQPTFDELRTRLYRPKFDRYISLELRESLLHDLNASAVWVDIGESAVYCRDRDDDKFIETALKAQAHYLVSGDNDLLEAAPLPSLSIISAQQALAVLGI